MKKSILLLDVLILMVSTITGCNATPSPTPPSLTAAPTPGTSTTVPTMSTAPVLIVQSSIREDIQVIFFNDKLQTVQSFASNMVNPFISPDRCQLNSLSYIDNQISIKIFDYEGNMIDSKAIPLTDTGTHFVYTLTMSPDGNWIAYKETSGDYGRSYADGEIQDVKIVRVISNEPQTPFRISERSSARWSNLSWSPDGKGLLYTDFDQNHRHQVFLFNPETGLRTQMTNLEMDYAISDLEWSRDSNSFAFFFFDVLGYESGKAEANGGIGIVLAAAVPKVDIVKNYINVTAAQIFWAIDGEQIMVLIQRSGNQPSVLTWYGLSNQSVIHSIDSTSFDPEWKIYAAFPLNDDLTSVGLLGHSVYIFDLPSRSYIKVDNPIITDRLLLGDLRILRDPSGRYRPIQCGLDK